MAKVKKNYIEADAVDASNINLGNNTALKGRNLANNGDVSIIKINTADKPEFVIIPEVTVDPATANQLARKSYVDDSISAIPAVPPVFEIQGNWNAATNTPTLVASVGTEKELYYVNVSGTTSLDGEAVWDKGDWIYFLNGVWNRADNVDAVSLVNGQAGVVVLDTDDLLEGVNKFYSEGQFDSSLSGKSTSDVSEGTNLYHTTARAKAAAVVNSTAGSETDQAASVAAMKSYVATAVDGAGGISGREVITLTALNITNGWFELAEPIDANSLSLSAGGVPQTPTDDFTESIVVTNTRVTFAGDLLANALENDKVICHYAY